ncbi:hypothetical protein FOXYSP1_16907 [Fusarium oxysporum f. sp. phaseoli]
MSTMWILCKAPTRMPPRGELLCHRHIPFALSLPSPLLKPSDYPDHLHPCRYQAGEPDVTFQLSRR